MNAPPPLEPGEFAEFFRAVHGHAPFPWQRRLAAQVATEGWPQILDLPTGTGKTAALDVALFTLALAAGRTPRSAPLRVVYVVDRRTIVDQAHVRAKVLRKTLVASDDDVVQRVRERLACYAPKGLPLQTALLRGGIAHDDLWARSPDQPLIVVSTVDQVGSRLLFRGYGVSDEMKPIHAGLLGCDVLYLLDEVHLSQPFRETLLAIRDRYRQWAERPLGDPFTIVEMSATPGSAVDGSSRDGRRATASAERVVRLDEEDRRDLVLSARLRASKPARLALTNAKGFIKEVEKYVLSMLDRPAATVAVVVNRVKSARELHRRLAESVFGGTVYLLTGRMRPFDRDALEQRLLPRIKAGRDRRDDTAPVVIVATQSIEAGADFDFDALVTECAALDALRQRFGRLDRMGILAGAARAVIVARSDALKEDAVYGAAIGKTWSWLQEIATSDVVDFGLEQPVVPEDAEERRLLTPKAHAPILLPAHLDAWVQTSPIPQPDPDVALWLHGPDHGAADVQIIWRADLDEGLLKQAVDAIDGDDNPAAEVAIGMIEALPPVSGEAMSVPFVAAKRWLEARSEPESFDVEGAADPDEDSLDPELEAVPRPAVLWLGENSKVIRASNLPPGQTIVVPASYGGIADGNWAPQSTAVVDDVAETASFRHRRRPVLRMHPAVLQHLFGSHVEVPKPDVDSEIVDDRAIVADWLEQQRDRIADGPLRELLDHLIKDGRSRRISRLPLGTGDTADQYFVVSGKRRPPAVDDDNAVDDRVTTGDNRSSFTGADVTLRKHLADVADVAYGFAKRLGLPADVMQDLRLAGEWHDCGKADPRFQRWLHGGSEFKALVQREPLAKSRVRPTRTAMRIARERAGFPKGGRHEFTSLALMNAVGDRLSSRATIWTFVQHVVASHHGYARPLAPYVPDPNPAVVTFSSEGTSCQASSAHQLERFDSGIADRFWLMVRAFGWWGLAWLETILRLADHRTSEEEQRSAGSLDE